MSGFWRSIVRFFVSLRLTVVLLALSILLVFLATLDQVHLGVWGIQHKWFFTLVVMQSINGIPIPVFPGGYFIGGLLLINLIAAHIYRFKFSLKKSGIWLAHLGLILLIFSQFLTGLQQRESQVQLNVSETKRYSEDFQLNELAVIDTSDPKFDDVVAVPESALARGEPIQHPKLPFRIVTHQYFPNSALQQRNQTSDLGNAGVMAVGPQQVIVSQPVTYKPDENNMPAAEIELVGPDGSLGTWYVSRWIESPQTFDYAGKTWQIVMRAKRYYTPYTLTLLQTKNDVYPGTDIPKNFSSRVRIYDDSGKGDREALIYMNNPLRYGGLTYYQYQMNKANGFSVLQVVRNPSWLLPYIACLMVAAGLVIQFSLHLFGFVRKRAALSNA